MPDTHSQALVASLARPRFEIVPTMGVEQQLAYLPADAVVAVASSPTKGMNATLALAAMLRRRDGMRVVPQIAARLVFDAAHLKDLMHQLADLALDEIVIVSGDVPQPAGEYDTDVALLRAMADIGHEFCVGVTGHPERPAFLSHETASQSLRDKEPFASYIVSQICFDPRVTARWIIAVRARGTCLPIFVGIPGAVDIARLVRTAARLGVGESLRILCARSGSSTLTGSYRPDELVDGLAPIVADADMHVAGWHLYTFNHIRNTEDWRQGMLARRAMSTPRLGFTTPIA